MVLPVSRRVIRVAALCLIRFVKHFLTFTRILVSCVTWPVRALERFQEWSALQIQRLLLIIFGCLVVIVGKLYDEMEFRINHFLGKETHVCPNKTYLRSCSVVVCFFLCLFCNFKYYGSLLFVVIMMIVHYACDNILTWRCPYLRYYLLLDCFSTQFPVLYLLIHCVIFNIMYYTKE